MLFDKNGPDPEDFELMHQMVDQIKPEQIDDYREAMKPMLHPATNIGFAFNKPFGYSGDFFIIEKMYQNYVSPDPKWKKWDLFFHRLPATIAVVNRKKIAVELLHCLNENAGGQARNVLILGSGPVTEVYEYLCSTSENRLYFDLIDMDSRAIAYATDKNRDFLEYLSFHNRNVIRYVPDKQYDLIWSAGLFDYFKDKHFVYLLKHYYAFLAGGGQMVIGNFSNNSPSRKIMEVLADWFLYHRSAEELLAFARQAGIPESFSDVISEPLGVNLFLRIEK